MSIFVEIPSHSPSTTIAGGKQCYEKHWVINYFKDAKSLDTAPSTKSAESLKGMSNDARSPPSR